MPAGSPPADPTSNSGNAPCAGAMTGTPAAIASATGISVFVGGNNSLSVSGAATISVRIALASSISA